jgi:hypothetical protein
MRPSIRLLLAIVFFPLYTSAQHIETVNGTCVLQPISTLSTISIPEKGGRYLVFSFERIPGENEVAALRAKGMELTGFVPPSAYIARLSSWDANLRRDVQRVFNGYGEIPVQLKLAPDLFSALPGEGIHFPQEFILSVYEAGELEMLRSMLTAQNIPHYTTSRTGTHCVVAGLGDQAQLQWVLALQNLESLARYYPEITEQSTNNSMQANQIHYLNYNRVGPTGKNTYFANIEAFGANNRFRLNSMGRNHPVYGLHYPDGLNAGAGSHGTTVGLYAAAANNYNEYEDRGMAEGVTYVYMPSYSDIEKLYTNYNLRPLTLNVSAGQGGPTVAYNAQAREFDRITRSLESFMLCMAAGNSGNTTNTTLSYGPGWANIIAEERTNKNNFTVHAGGNPGEHYEWASKGPTRDGRLKPDISPEGWEGTSNASPSMAGMVNVLFESYQESYHTAPRGDVVKAVVLNTAIDADKKGIDFKTGFGTLNPIRAHRAIQQQHVFTGSMPQGTTGSTQYTISIPAGTRMAKILLYWHDYPGTVGAAKALVNDLNIKVNTPSGQTFLPWVLDPTPGRQYDLPVRKTDNLNNVEQVTIDDPQAGVYTITVSGSYVPFGPQPFVLTYDLLPYHIEITSPAAGFRTARGKQILFTWNAALATGNPANQIELILQKQTGQSAVIATLPDTQIYYRYTIPADFPNSATARLIVRQKNTPYADTSDYFHVMESPSGLSFRSICTERIRLQWDAVNVPGTEYILYRLGEKYMEEVGRADYPATSLLLEASALPGANPGFKREEWFAIAAKHPNGAISLRSLPVCSSQVPPLSLPMPYQKEYTICFGDSVLIRAHELERDSIRWYRNGSVIAGAVSSVMTFRAGSPGDYFYREFQQGCVYTSDTFRINSLLHIDDTSVYGDRSWNVYVLKNDDPGQYYGRVVMPDLAINSTKYYRDLDGQINDAPRYIGCRPGQIYTLLYKRKGFVKGYYKMTLDHIQLQASIFINGQLVYTSPQNVTNQGVIWQGYLDEESTVRIVQPGRVHTIMKLDIQASGYATPGHTAQGPELWLQGSKAAYDSAGLLSTWRDSNPYGMKNNPSSGAGIRVEPAGINYNPVLVFNNLGGIHGKISSGTFNEGSTFAVFHMQESSHRKARVLGFSLASQSDDQYSFSYTPFCRKDSSAQLGVYRNTFSLFPSAALTGQWNLLLTGMKQGECFIASSGTRIAQGVPTFPGLFYDSYNIGTRYDSVPGEGRFRGEIAEIIHYTTPLSPEETRRVHTYLALKYGFSLPHSYQSGSGREVYTAGDYNQQIAGIAREDAQDLLQKQSRSNEAIPDVFTGSLGAIASSNAQNSAAFAGDSSYVIWGHNGAPALYTGQWADSSLKLQRTWRLQHTGKAGTFRFHFDDTLNPPLLSCEEYRLLLGTDLSQPASTRLYELYRYTAADGKTYAYADVSFLSDTVLYFSLIRKQRIFTDQALPLQSAALVTCIAQDTLALTDSSGQYRVAQVIFPPASAAQDNQLVLRTDHTEASLASCNDTTRLSVLNRLLHVTFSPDSGTIRVRLFLLPEDSLNALHNPALAGCDPFRHPLRWFLEENEDSLAAKIRDAQALSWIPDQEVQLTSDSSGFYVDIRNLPLRHFILGAALYDTTMKPPPVILSAAFSPAAGISVYPNPVRNELSVEVPQAGSSISLYNVYGQCLYRATATEAITKIALPYAPGMYMIAVEGRDGSVYKQKVMKAAE